MRLIDGDAVVKNICDETPDPAECNDLGQIIVFAKCRSIVELSPTIEPEKKKEKEFQFIELLKRPIGRKMYYDIRYLDRTSNKIHVGFGSYKLSVISDYLKRYFL